MRALRVNGQITEATKIMANSKMGDHLGSMHFVFLDQQKY